MIILVFEAAKIENSSDLKNRKGNFPCSGPWLSTENVAAVSIKFRIPTPKDLLLGGRLA